MRGGGGQRPFGSFPKIHPFWWGQASLSKSTKYLQLATTVSEWKIWYECLDPSILYWGLNNLAEYTLLYCTIHSLVVACVVFCSWNNLERIANVTCILGVFWDENSRAFAWCKTLFTALPPSKRCAFWHSEKIASFSPYREINSLTNAIP